MPSGTAAGASGDLIGYGGCRALGAHFCNKVPAWVGDRRWKSGIGASAYAFAVGGVSSLEFLARSSQITFYWSPPTRQIKGLTTMSMAYTTKQLPAELLQKYVVVQTWLGKELRIKQI